MLFSKVSLFSISRKTLLLLVVAVMVLMPLVGFERKIASAAQPLSVAASEIDPTVAIDWINLLYMRVEKQAANAPGSSRLYAYGGIAVYEAIVPGIDGGLSLSGQLTNMPAMPTPDNTKEYDWASSVTGAMSVVLTGILQTSDDTTKAITDLRTKQIAEQKKSINAEIVDRSVAYGESVGKLIVEWSKTDNAAEAHAKAKDYVVPANIPSDWVVTTPGRPPVEPYWGTVRPFGLTASDVCPIPQDMEYSEDPNSTFYAQANEVKTVGEKLTDEQKAISLFWLDTPGETGAPAGHWVSIASQLVQQIGGKLDKAGQAFALVGIAVGDAFIACWDLKYKVMLMRPETYIQKFIRRSWKPFVQTPVFPEFVSGHSTVSETAAQVLTSFFGTIAFKDSTHQIYNHPNPPRPPRTFTSLEAAAQEAAISRLYGGIHFRAGIEGGLKQGRCLAAMIISRVHLKAQ